MRCKVKVDSNDRTVRVDLRTNWKQAGSSIVAAAKEVGSSGEVSLVVENDRHEGAAAMVVVIDSGGAVAIGPSRRGDGASSSTATGNGCAGVIRESDGIGIGIGRMITRTGPESSGSARRSEPLPRTKPTAKAATAHTPHHGPVRFHHDSPTIG